MIKKKKLKDFGSLKNIDINITLPIEIKTSVDMNRLTLMTGTNGSGKSLILKLIWLLSVYASLKSLKGLKDTDSSELNELLQKFIDSTFDNNNFTGEINGFYDGGNVRLSLDNGKILNYDININENLTNIPMPIYMSTQTRTYEQIEKFIKIDEKCKADEILEIYKLYDILFCQTIIDKYEIGIVVNEIIKESLIKFGLEKYDIESFGFKDDKFIFTNKKGEEKRLTSLSAGEQSLLNMLLANI